MKYRLLFLLFAGLIIGILCSAESRIKSQRVSLVQLIATPERFQGKDVWVFGYFVDKREHQALYLTKDDATYRNYQASLWISLPNDAEIKRPKHGFVFVRGYFSTDTNGCGHWGLWPGELTNVLEIAVAGK